AVRRGARGRLLRGRGYGVGGPGERRLQPLLRPRCPHHAPTEEDAGGSDPVGWRRAPALRQAARTHLPHCPGGGQGCSQPEATAGARSPPGLWRGQARSCTTCCCRTGCPSRGE
ncbi:uidB, partial [Symbiodinium pilosum]